MLYSNGSCDDGKSGVEEAGMTRVLSGKPKWMLLVWGGVLLISIKRTFADFDIDSEFAIVMAYRMARGDNLITQMWEPYQTSAFLNAFFIRIYMLLTGTTTGIAVYLNAAGLLVKLGVAHVFYRTFRNDCNRDILFLICAFFMAVNAKNVNILEHSNMMVYSSVLLCCALFAHLRVQGHSETVFLALAAICFCMDVLSYPSTIILFPLMLLILYRYSAARGRDMALFSGICFLCGSGFLAFLIIQSGWDRFRQCVKYIVTGDNSHQIGDLKWRLGSHIADIASAFALFAICAFLAFVIVRLFLRKRIVSGRSISVQAGYIGVFFLMLIAQYFILTLADSDNLPLSIRLLDSAVYMPSLLVAFRLRRYCSREEKMAFHIGAGISVGGVAAVLVLTNCSFLSAVAYMILGVMVSMIPIGEYLRQTSSKKGSVKIYGMLFLFVAVVLFRNIYMVQTTNRKHVTVFSIANVVKNGPMVGIFSDYMEPYIRNTNWNEWKQYVQKGDRVLIVGYPRSTVGYSLIGYLYEDTEISIDSTVPTPTYNEKLLAYWEMNPWKEPNVVVLDCWFGEPHVAEDEWIMQWIEENFESYADGTYIRVYRRE